MFSKKTVSLLLISFVGLIDIMGIGLVYPMFASMMFQRDCLMLPADTSDAMRGSCLGLLLATMPLVQFFSAPILGMLSDKKGRKKILLPSLLVGVFGYFLAVIAANTESLPLLLLSRIAIGISAGTVPVVGAALTDISTAEEKAKNFGFLNMACGLGFTIGPFLGGVLSNFSFFFLNGYSLTFALAGFITLINFFFVAFLFEETYTPKEIGKPNLFQGIYNIKKAFLNKNLQAIFSSVFLACMGWSFYWEFAPVTWINQHGFNATSIGNIYAYGAAVYAFSCGLLIRPIVSKFSNQHILCAALFGCAVSIGMLLFHTDIIWLWIYIPCQQFCIALFWPTASTVVSNSVSEDLQGETLGVLQSIDSLAFAVGPLVSGPLLGISASMPIIIGCGTMILAATLLGASLKRSTDSSPIQI